ncbi:MAG: kynureninase, partial [Gaiellales bacterium]
MSAADRRNAEQLDATDPLAELRSGFVVDDGWIYVDGNSLGRLHRTVAGRLGDAVDDWGRRLVTGWRDWIDLPEA